MDPKKFKILIDSINGGMSSYDYSAGEEQFYDALGINPDDNGQSNTGRGVGPGMLVPTKPRRFSMETLTGVPLWMKGEPKGGNIYVYDMNGSVYTLGETLGTFTALGDLNDAGSARGNGMEYYDNYMYFARDTTIARYGPLNGTPAFTDDYWITTLGKTALEHQGYPTRDSSYTDARYPNHVMHRHRDRLYFADTIGGQGYIHYISTTKTSVEGDTDNGSTYGALDLPYGYFVTDIASLGDDIVISAFEGKSGLNASYPNGSYEGRSALFFWDTTSNNYYKVIQNEFPDQIITALENANGVLYTFSANILHEPTGVRICRYLGGNSFEQISFLTDVDTPFAGGTLSRLNQILFTSVTQQDQSRACVWAVGSQNQPLSNAVFNVSGARYSAGAGHAICQEDGGAPWSTEIYYSYSQSNTSGIVEGFGGNESNWDTDLISSTNGSGGVAQGHAYWKSQWYTIGSRIKVKKVKVFVTQTINSSMDFRVYLNKDLDDSETIIGTIDNTNYPSKRGAIILRPNGYIAEHSIQLIVRWFGTDNNGIRLPIEIEYEIMDDD